MPTRPSEIYCTWCTLETHWHPRKLLRDRVVSCSLPRTSVLLLDTVFAERCSFCEWLHCSRSASIGSIEAARSAGMNPATAALIASVKIATQYASGLSLLTL